MKLFHAAALALSFAAPVAFASPTGFVVDFEKAWDYANGDVNGYYAGGTAADGTTGANLGVSFTNISGLSNDATFTYYAGAPTPLGTAYAHTFAAGDKAFMNVVGGVGGALSLFYSSPSTVLGAVRAFSGLNGTGTLLGTYDFVANSSSAYDAWSQVTLAFSGIAQSFDFTGAANLVGLDNISAAAVPEPETLVLLMVGGAAALALRGRRRS